MTAAIISKYWVRACCSYVSSACVCFGINSQISTELTTLLLHAVCTHPLPKLIWPPSEPSNTPPLLYLQEEGRMQEGSVLG